MRKNGSIAFLDNAAPDPDLEEDEHAEEDPGEDDGTEEPSLGSFDRLMNQEHAWKQKGGAVSFYVGAEHDDCDREDDDPAEDDGTAEPDDHLLPAP